MNEPTTNTDGKTVVLNQPPTPRQVHPENNTELFLVVRDRTYWAQQICKTAAVRGSFGGVQLAELLTYLRRATAAAQELQNRANGNPPALVGP